MFYHLARGRRSPMISPDPRWVFNTNDAQRLSGVSARRLQYWDETDFIRPSIAARKGRGWPRLYAFRDIVQLRVAALLRDRLSLPALRRPKGRPAADPARRPRRV